MAFTPGSTVDRYRIEAVVGAGSMGDVVRAVDVELNRPVALKILSTRHRDNKELRARFVREGRAVAAISHPNVVQVFTTGTYDERPYIAMEFLRGVDLGTVVRERGTMSSGDTARAALDATRGLEAAARAGLIHRDIKPSNLMLTEEGVVKVTDFGLAKPLDPKDEPALTAMGVVVGTPDYIAPEQARGETIDERVDIYALGGTMFTLVTGTPPFRTGNPSEDKYLKVVSRHLKEPVPDPRSKNPAVDPELAAVIMRMMAKKADDRPRHAQLIAELAQIADRLRSQGGSGLVKVQRGQTETPFVGGEVRLPEELRTGTTVNPGFPRWLIAFTVIAVGVFLAGAGMLLYGRFVELGDGAHVAVTEPAPEDAVRPRDPNAPLTPPAGMVLVTGADGKPGFFCGTSPVSESDVRPPPPKKKVPKKPATRVGFDEAQAFAAAQGKRLLTPNEWNACSATAGFVFPAPLWEWVDDGSRGAQAPRTVLRAAGERSQRIPTAHNDVTFRLAEDI